MTELKFPRRRALVLSGGFLASPMVASGVARAQATWPNKSVKYVVPFPAGGPTDTLSRIVCRELEKLTGQTFIIENKSGSGGLVGADAVAKSAPDGYTIGLYTIAAHAIAPTLYAKMPFDAGKDVTGISILWEVPNMLMTRLDFPANTVPEMIALLKANPGKYSFASSGAGTSPHITGELFKSMAGVDILHVPYRGGAPAIQDMIAGNVSMMFGNMPEFLGQIGGGNLIPVAFGAPRRSPMFPKLPLISQYLPGFSVVNWFAVFGSKGLPTGLVDFWNKALHAAVVKPEVQKRFEESGMDTIIGSPADLKATIVADRKKWAEVIKEAGMRAD